MTALATEPSRLERREAEIAREVRNAVTRNRLLAARPFQLPIRRELLTMLLIGGDELAAGLGAFCRLARPERPEALPGALAEQPIDLVFIELSFDLGEQQAWRALLGREENRRRQPAIDQLAGLNAPTLLWLTEPAAGRSAFADTLFALGNLFVADAGTGDHGGHPLPPAFDPHRFNPLKPTRAGSLVNDVSVLLLDQLRALMYGADRDALAVEVARFAAFPLAIAESRWKLRPDADHLSPAVLDRYLGRIEPDQRQALLALARFAIVPGAGDIGAARQRLEALGSATLPVLAGGDGQPDPFALSAADTAERILPRYPGLFWQLEQQAHRGYRDAHHHHSYQARLRQALHRCDDSRAAELAERLTPDVERCRVEMIVPTLRPWQLPFVHAMFNAQTHGAKRLALMIHGDPFDLSAHFPAIAADDRVRWRFVPSRYGIGTLLNIAIEESEVDYWAKMDDDDFYGPDYIADYVLLGSYAAFGIAGKSNLFTYDEADDAVFIRKDVNFTFAKKDTLAGGSFFCRRGAELLPFDERVCGYADMDFLWRNEAAGQAIVASDRYNFCQIRRRDRSSHTWKIRSEDIVGRERVANGRRFGVVCA